MLSLLLAACSGGDDPTPTPTATQVPNPIATATPTVTPIDNSSGAFTDLALVVVGPADGTTIQTDAVRVIGTVRQDAVVAVNGSPAEVASDGGFAATVDVAFGINEIEVIATDLTGNVASQYLVVFRDSSTAGVPLAVSSPTDGMIVGDPTVTVTGTSRQDAIVAVNGAPVSIDASGAFNATVSLVQGANLVEITATDIAGNVNTRSIAVFYQP
jgi:large repetitive protein